MAENRSGNDQGRDELGQFVPGVSGNPAGRPKGIADKRVQAKDDLVGRLLPKAIEKLEAAVDKNERWAVELVMTFALPRPRPADPEELEELEARLFELEQIANSRRS